MPNFIIDYHIQKKFSKIDLCNKSSIEEIRANLLDWFNLNGRNWIPWKLDKNGMLPKDSQLLPVYPIFIAEIMLQQTQLNVVLPYWEEWMRVFPTLNHLADSNLSDVLLNWQGLGYYSRAKRIHKASQILLKYINKNNSLDVYLWPKDLNTWMELPGIGRSTAGSILSSAFNFPISILDGNVKRILSRLFSIQKPLSKNLDELWYLSNLLLDKKFPRKFNQALMDLGASVCTFREPLCIQCPLKVNCFAYNFGNPLDFPVRGRRKSLPKVTIGIGLIINRSGEILIDQRVQETSMGGMWEFPGGKKETEESIRETIIREIQEELGLKVRVGELLIEFDHAYSHKKLHFVVHLCDVIAGEPKALSSSQIRWVKFEELANYPFPAANTKMIKALKKYLENKKNHAL